MLNNVNYWRFVDGRERRAITKDTRIDMFPVMVLAKDKNNEYVIPTITLLRHALIHLQLNKDCRLTVPIDNIELINKTLTTHPAIYSGMPCYKGRVFVHPLKGGKQLIQVVYKWNKGWNSIAGWYLTDGKSITPKYYDRYFEYSSGYTWAQLIVAFLGNIVLWIAIHRFVRRKGRHHRGISDGQIS